MFIKFSSIKIIHYLYESFLIIQKIKKIKFYYFVSKTYNKQNIMQ